MAQQTAVEWLISELQIRLLRIKSEPNGIVRETMINNFLIDTDQAKQMEKEQSKQDYDAGLFDGTMDDVKDRLYKNAEQYYNETYGNESV